MSKEYISNGALAISVSQKRDATLLKVFDFSAAQLKQAKKLGFKDDGRLFEMTRYPGGGCTKTETIQVNSIVGQMVFYLLETDAWLKENSLEKLRNTKPLNPEDAKNRYLIRKQREARIHEYGVINLWLRDNLGDIFYRFID